MKVKNININEETTCFEKEMAWREEMSRRDTGREIMETMSYTEAKNVLTPNMENSIDKKKDFDKKYRQIKRISKKYYAPDTFEFNFAVDAVWLLKFMNGDMENQDLLKSLEHYWLFNESRKPRAINNYQAKTDLTQLISEAKNITIESLSKNPFKNSGVKRLVSLCPFHTEKTPSFTIFTNTNTFVCFGCGVKGDSIAFYQKLYGVGFVDAVKSLAGRY